MYNKIMNVSHEVVRNVVEDLVPFLKTIGIKLKEITPDSVTLYLPKDERIMNHIGSFYAGAIFKCNISSEENGIIYSPERR